MPEIIAENKLEPEFYNNRKSIARKHLFGSGIEIGALHTPLPVSQNVIVKYVDRYSKIKLLEHYPEIDKDKIVETDIIDDCETLSTVSNESQDFVIANHVLEHCEDPIKALTNFFRVIKKNGIIFFCIPIKKYNIDHQRPTTSYPHLLFDHFISSALSRPVHYFGWSYFCNKKRPIYQAIKWAQHLNKMNYSIHFHVWSERSFFKFIKIMQRKLTFEVVHFARFDSELVCILRK